VDVVEPDRVENFVGLDSPGQAAQTALEQTDLLVQQAQDLLQRRPAAAPTTFTNR